MIISDDKDILEQTETKLIADLIRRTILSRFEFSIISSNDCLYMYYVNPKTKNRYIEIAGIVDIYINEEYKNLKECLKDHYAVRKYTKVIDEPFERKKRYHFIIENSTLYYDFYIVCEMISRPDSHYHSYKFYVKDPTKFLSK